MPISDAYIVQYLLDGTARVPAQITWTQRNAEHAAFLACVEDVDVIFEPIYSRTSSRLVLRFQHAGEQFSICEPARRGWLGRKFWTEDERRLALLFRELAAAISSQCTARRHHSESHQDEIRDRIGRQLLFGRATSR